MSATELSPSDHVVLALQDLVLSVERESARALALVVSAVGRSATMTPALRAQARAIGAEHADALEFATRVDDVIAQINDGKVSPRSAKIRAIRQDGAGLHEVLSQRLVLIEAVIAD